MEWVMVCAFKAVAWKVEGTAWKEAVAWKEMAIAKEGGTTQLKAIATLVELDVSVGTWGKNQYCRYVGWRV